MIYPIIPYGKPILRQKAAPLKQETNVKTLIHDMFATMDMAKGVGLAAPQIGQSLQLFVVDISYFIEGGAMHRDKYRKVYINPIIEIPKPNTTLFYEEGCLSIPDILVDVPRSKSISIKYFDENWQPRQEELTDMPARVVQHEYDHIHGKLHIDYLPVKKLLLLKPKLENIKKGKVKVKYNMLYNHK